MRIARFPEGKLLTTRKAETHTPKEMWINWANPPWPALNALGLYEYTAPVAGTDYDPTTHKLGALTLNGTMAAEEVLPRTLAEVQVTKQDEIRAGFEDEMRNGTATTAGGWPIDARRSDIHNDLENMQALHDELTASGAPGVDIMGADNQTHYCTVAEVADLVTLLRQTGLARYQKRHAKKAQIEAATTVEAVVAVQW